MQVQVKTDLVNKPFILFGMGLIKSAQTLKQDAGRTVDLEYGTLMAFETATEKWVPFTDETATDGTAHPSGIVLQKILTADIAAGDVEDVQILVGDAIIDESQLVIENSKTLATTVNVPNGLNKSVEQLLRWLGLYPRSTIDITETA